MAIVDYNMPILSIHCLLIVRTLSKDVGAIPSLRDKLIVDLELFPVLAYHQSSNLVMLPPVCSIE